MPKEITVKRSIHKRCGNWCDLREHDNFYELECHVDNKTWLIPKQYHPDIIETMEDTFKLRWHINEDDGEDE